MSIAAHAAHAVEHMLLESGEITAIAVRAFLAPIGWLLFIALGIALFVVLLEVVYRAIESRNNPRNKSIHKFRK